MKLDKDQENEDIESLIIKDKDSVIESDILEVPDYSYWFNQESLDYKRLRNKPDYSKVKLKAIQNSSLSTISYTWIWFKPTSIECNHYVASWSNWNFWYSYYEWGIYNAYTWYAWWTSSPWNYIASWQSPSWFINATIDSLDDDWFTLTYTWWWTPPTLNMMFKCFW